VRYASKLAPPDVAPPRRLTKTLFSIGMGNVAKLSKSIPGSFFKFNHFLFSGTEHGQLTIKTVFLALSLLLFPCVGIGLSVPTSLGQLVDEAEAVVFGEVIGTNTYRKTIQLGSDVGEDEAEIILTDFIIRVDEYLHGELSESEFVITSWGGKIGKEREWISFSFVLNPGQQILVFARRDEKNDVWWGVEQSAGVFTTLSKNGITYLLPTSEDAVLIDGEIVSPKEAMEMEQNEFTISRVRELLLKKD
jgi:hypothetical protein